MNRFLPRLFLTIALLCTTSNSYGYVLPVIDAGDIVQNTITAIQTSISAIQNYLQVQNSNEQVRIDRINLMPGLHGNDDLEQFLRRLNEVLRTGQALHYQLTNLDSEMHGRFPGYQNPGRWTPQYEMWTTTTLDTLRGMTNTVHEQLKESEQGRERGVLDQLRTNSAAAQGNLAVGQAGNAIGLQNAEELRKVTQLLGAQLNAQTVALSHQVNLQAAGDRVFADWVEKSQIPVVAYSGSGGFGPDSFGH